MKPIAGCLVAGLTLLGLGLGGCADAGVRPTAVTQLRDSADQVIFRMSTNIHEESIRRSHVQAETAYVYQNRQTMELRGLHLRLFDELGNHRSTLTARVGVYNTLSGSLDARGSVVVQSTDGRRLRTEHLIYDRIGNTIRSDTAFVYDSRTEHGTGNGFQSDIAFRNLVVQQPKGFQRGRGITLPGPGQ